MPNWTPLRDLGTGRDNLQMGIYNMNYFSRPAAKVVEGIKFLDCWGHNFWVRGVLVLEGGGGKSVILLTIITRATSPVCGKRNVMVHIMCHHLVQTLPVRVGDHIGWQHLMSIKCLHPFTSSPKRLRLSGTNTMSGQGSTGNLAMAD